MLPLFKQPSQCARRLHLLHDSLSCSDGQGHQHVHCAEEEWRACLASEVLSSSGTVSPRQGAAVKMVWPWKQPLLMLQSGNIQRSAAGAVVSVEATLALGILEHRAEDVLLESKQARAGVQFHKLAT